MSKEMAVIALGVWVVVMPYLGIYRSWLTVLMVLTGVALMIIGFLLRGEVIAKEHKNGHGQKRSPARNRKSHMPFEENTVTVEQDYSSGDSSVPSL
jgi:hypothetical protein